MSQPKALRKGFTLLELIVVLVVLGLLAAIAIPTYQRVIQKSEDRKVETELAAMTRNALALWNLDNAAKPHDSATWAATWQAAVATSTSEVTYAAASGVSADQAKTWDIAWGRDLVTERYADVKAWVIDDATAPIVTNSSGKIGLTDVSVVMLSGSGNVCRVVFNVSKQIGPACNAPDASPATPSSGWALDDGGEDPGGGGNEQSPMKITGLAGVPGDGAITLNWTALGAAAAVTGYKVYLFDDPVAFYTQAPADGTLTTLAISGQQIVNGQTYGLSMAAMNGAVEGPRSDMVFVTPVTVPYKVTGVTTRAGNAKAFVSWQPDDFAGAPVTGYRVYVDGVLATTVPTSYAELGELTNGQTYAITVSGYRGAVGTPVEGEQSDPASVTPRPDAPNVFVFDPALPPDPVGGAPGDAKAFLGFAPVVSTVTSPVIGYSFYVDVNGSWVPVTASHVEVDQSGWSVTIEGFSGSPLVNGTSYTFAVASVVTGGLEGPLSITPNVAAGRKPTPNSIYDVPSMPLNLTGAGQPSRAYLTWAPGAVLANAPVTGFNIYADGTQVASVPSKQLAVTVRDLLNGKPYIFQVSATGPGGESERSAPATVTPAEDPTLNALSDSEQTAPPAPGAPIVNSGNTVLHLGWSKVVSTDSYTVKMYRVYVDGAPYALVPQTTIATDHSVHFDVTGLTNGVAYAIQIVAVGTALPSAPSPVTTGTPYGLAGQPVNVHATPGISEVSLTWDAVATTPGSPVNGYNIYINGSGSAAATVPGVGSVATTVTALTNGTVYSFQVAAYGPGGVGPLSEAVSAAPSNAPATPQNLAAEGAAGRVVLTWNQTLSTTTTPTVGYRIYMDGSSVPLQNVDQAVNNQGNELPVGSYAVPDMIAGQSHSFQITAYNNTGESAVSAAVNGAAVDAPGAVVLSLGSATNLTATVNWTTPAGAGPFSAFRLFVNGHPTVQIAAARTATVDLTPGQANTIQIFAYSSRDTGPASNVVSVDSYAAPLAATNVNFTPVPAAGAQIVTITWTLPSAATYKPRTGLDLYVNGTKSQTLTASATSATATGLSYGVLHTFTVKASGPGGEAFSDSINFTPQLSPATPAAPALVEEADGRVRVSFVQTTSSASAPVLGHRIYKSAALFSTVAYDDPARCVAGVCTVSIEPLTNGTTYSIQVDAYGPGGSSNLSDALFATPSAPITIAGTAVAQPFTDSFVAAGPSSPWVTSGVVSNSAGVLEAGTGAATVKFLAGPNGDMRYTATVALSNSYTVVFRAQDDNNFWMLRRTTLRGYAFPCQVQLLLVSAGVRTVVQSFNQGSAGQKCSDVSVSGNVVVTSLANGALTISAPGGVSHSNVYPTLKTAYGFGVGYGRFDSVNVTSSPQAASSPSAAAVSGSAISVNWSASPSATSYLVTASGGVSSGQCTTTTTSCVVSGLKKGTSFFVTVAAMRDGMSSPTVSVSGVATPSTFSFASHGDTNGLIYFLGTHNDLDPFSNPSGSGFAANWPAEAITVSSSTGSPTVMTDRTVSSVSSITVSCSSGATYTMTLPAGHSLSPTNASLRLFSTLSQHSFLGSNDGTTWTSLAFVNPPDTVAASDVLFTPTVNYPYHMFRFTTEDQLGDCGVQNTSLSDVELYGTYNDFIVGAPTLLGGGASTVSSQRVELHWTNGVGDVATVQVLRNGSLLTTLGADSTSFVDTSVSNGTLYSYTLRSGASDGTLSEPSNALSFTPAAWANVSQLLPGAISYALSVALNDGNILVAGGWSVNPTSMVSTATKYDPTTGTRTSAASMPNALSSVGLTTDDSGYVWSAGGFSSVWGTSSSIYRYNPSLNSWSSGFASLPASRGGAAVGWYNNKLYVVGGISGSAGTTPTNTVYAYNTSTNTMSTLGVTAPTAIGRAAYATIGSNLYIFGGINSNGTTAVSNAYVFNMATESFTTLASMPVANGWTQNAGVLADGRILYAGSATASTTFVNTMYIYNPYTGTYTSGPVRPTACFGATVASSGSYSMAIGCGTGSGSSFSASTDARREIV